VSFLDFELSSGSTPGPTHRSYWVVEGRFAAGAYPSRSRPLEPGQIPDVTAALLDAGITCFVNLTEDHPGGGDSHLTRYQDHVIDSAVVFAHPIVDVDIPTVDEMVATLDAIDDHFRGGGTCTRIVGAARVGPERWSDAGLSGTATPRQTERKTSSVGYEMATSAQVTSRRLTPRHRGLSSGLGSRACDG